MVLMIGVDIAVVILTYSLLMNHRTGSLRDLGKFIERRGLNAYEFGLLKLLHKGITELL